MYDVNFIAYAIDLKKNKNTGICYEDFIIPFTFFCLLFNKNSHVEIIVLDPDNFKKKYDKEIDSIKKINSNFLIRKPMYKLNRNVPNTYRFFEVPIVKSKYTYISDIDIMYMEEILYKYLDTWPGNLAYHNILRTKNTCQLTGVFMVETDKYYTPEFENCQKKYYDYNAEEIYSDELILGKMCNEIHGLPDLSFKYRPILGIHFSPNRGNDKKTKLRTYQRYYDTFMKTVNDYTELFKYRIFNNLLTQLKNDFLIK